jgi:hypothetical protein
VNTGRGAIHRANPSRSGFKRGISQRFLAKQPLCHRTSANIASANEENFGHLIDTLEKVKTPPSNVNENGFHRASPVRFGKENWSSRRNACRRIPRHLLPRAVTCRWY